MRFDAADYEMIAPGSLEEALGVMAGGGYLPIAGGTEVMVALSAGRLAALRLMSLHLLRELRFIEAGEDGVRVGSGSTFTDLRRESAIQEGFELLARAASWTGSIANQNRATLGGNIVNGSPAADSSPALLVYEAMVEVVSLRGVRTVPYREFHVGYKKTALASDELVHSVFLPRLGAGWRGYIRKVGTRNAQAISKVALAGLARVESGLVREVRIGAASLREVPTRCGAAEAALVGRKISEETIVEAQRALAGEVTPIDDRRSTALYRAAVANNLLKEFLEQLG